MLNLSKCENPSGNLKVEVTMRCERRIHECAHLFDLDDRLSRNVEGEMVPSVARFFHQRAVGSHPNLGSYKKLCERSYGCIALICAIFRDAGAGQRRWIRGFSRVFAFFEVPKHFFVI